MSTKQGFSDNIMLFSQRLVAFQNEILSILPSKTLREIKEKDPSPYFQLYTLCHEGYSTPTVEGEGQKKIFWPKKAIQSIKNLVLKGVKCFIGHNEANDIITQKEIGEIVYSFEDEIDGVLHHKIITYHPPDVREEAKTMNICSQEARWNLIEQAGNVIADVIEKISGVALGNSEKEKPAFINAKRLSYVQAFNNNEKNFQRQGANMSDELEKRVERMSFKQWKAMKDEFYVHPWQMFTEEELKNDREFGKIFSKLDALEKENKALKEQYEKETKELQEKVTFHERQSYVNSANNRLKGIIEKNNFPNNMKVFVEKAFEKGKEKIEDLSDKGLEQFIDSQKEVFQNVMSILEVDVPVTENNETEEPKEDYTKAENNEFLEEDTDLTV